MKHAVYFVLGLAVTPFWSAAADKLTVHEWGTFTSLVDESGRSIGGINADDEPVPAFVHRYPNALLYNAATGLQGSSGLMMGKGIPGSHPDVRMRMETPVVYFYPPADQPQMRVDVDVSFVGGWLTEFFPFAEAAAPGVLREIDANGNEYHIIGNINPHEKGTLSWRNLLIGADTALTETDAEVWLAPRQVDSAFVSMPNGETEKYLFYRGVGNLDSPLNVMRSTEGLSLQWQEDLSTSALWLVDVKKDGRLAFRQLPPDSKTVSLTFADDEYSSERYNQLHSSMMKALVADGLYEKEAAAMLATWQAAYFKSPGKRLFYLLPREWTDRVLPLNVSVEADVVRTMVGRIELVSAEHHQLMSRMNQAEYDLNWQAKAIEARYPDEKQQQEISVKLITGQMTYAEAGLTLPVMEKSFDDLGRFRVPLLIHYSHRYQSSPLQLFKIMKGIRFYTPANIEALTEKKAAS